MVLDGALSGEQKKHNLELIKEIVLKDLNEIIRITCDRMGNAYDCHIEFMVDVTLIPDKKEGS